MIPVDQTPVQHDDRDMSIAFQAVQYRNAKTPYDAMCATLEALDHNDAELAKYPQAMIDALAAVGYAVVPCGLPYAVLGKAGITGVFETGNPKHGWDWLLAKTRIGPNALYPEAYNG